MTLVEKVDAASSVQSVSTLSQRAGGPAAAFVSAWTTDLFLLEDIENTNRTGRLADSDLVALRTAADWIRTFVAEPHKDLGRPGPVCPYVPKARERKELWLAPERIEGRSLFDVIQLVDEYKKLLLDAHPTTNDDGNYKSIVVVFTDLSADRAKALFDDVLQHLAVLSYAEDGLVLGGFYKRNAATAIYNSNFRPFAPPVPFLLMRHAIIGDWKFFLDNEQWLNLWARRYGESAVRTLADELRRLPWRTGRD